jgi:site-specific DNA-cytosine methylase
MTVEFVDVQGFAGGFTCGAVQAGLELVGKREMHGGFGVPSCEENRHILGTRWRTEVGDYREWTPMKVPAVLGNPPCSGFSLMSRKEWRGVDSPANACMHALIEYAALCDPEIVAFESVQQAFTGGRPLMQKLRATLEEKTGHHYDLVHILQQGYHLGGPAWRPRYFATFTRIPFGVEPGVKSDVTWGSLMSDLNDQPLTWGATPYKFPGAHPWVERELRHTSFVDAHATLSAESPMWCRMRDLYEMIGSEWPDGWNITMALKECYRRHGRLPESWKWTEAKLVAKNFEFGFHQPNRWKKDNPCRVMTGGATGLVIHPFQFRPLTVREVMRGQGFPDDWRACELPMKGVTGAYWGKGIPVQVGRWMGTWVRESIQGAPGSIVGAPIGDRERLIDVQKLSYSPCSRLTSVA